MTDYSKLIDAETWAFIDRTNAFYPPETVSFTIEQQRAVYDEMCTAFRATCPKGVTAHDTVIDAGDHAIPVRIYDSVAEPAALVVYYHGGGGVVGGLDSHDDACAEICGQTGYRVVSVDYRLCPEHIHPAAFEDALAGFRWAAENFAGPILLAGDSEGARHAAAVAHAIRKDPCPPAGQVLLYPWLGADMTKGSYVTHAEAPMLTTRDLEFYRDIRAGGADTSHDPTATPLADTDFSNLPPTVIFSAECDPLCDDGRDYRDRLLTAGGKAVWFREKGLVHGYLRARHSVERARASFTRIVGAIRALGQGDWPY
ncbi:MAG: alpha/beta hydrolase [Salaquimonas sp.]|jgi:acetyl esterase|nr:alpha/beta hydrolase [Salaquimonas sp.]